MRSLAVWTTTAAVALLGVAANAQTNSAAPALLRRPRPRASTCRPQSPAMPVIKPMSPTCAPRRSAATTRLKPRSIASGRHNKDDMTRGWVAYGSQVAAQSPAFVQGVRDAAAFYGRDAVSGRSRLIPLTHAVCAAVRKPPACCSTPSKPTLRAL